MTACAACGRLEDIVRNHGIHGFRTSSLYTGLPASDRRYYPLYAKCVELDIPVRIYTAMSYANDRPYDLGHPRHLDQVAMDFPELRIVAGLSGWPWANETVGYCAVIPTCMRTRPRTGRVISRRPAPAGRCSCSSATRCFRTRS